MKLAGGVKNAGGMVPLEAGYKPYPISLSPADSQMLENRLFNVEDICRWFRIAPYLVGHTEKSTSWGTGLEQQNLAFLTYTLSPYIARIEKAISKWLLKPTERREFFAEFNLEGLLRADSKGRAEAYRTALQNGYYTRNEVRAKENLVPKEGGDILTVQSNMIPLDMLGKLPVSATVNKDDE